MGIRFNALQRSAVVPTIVTDGHQSTATWSLNTKGLSGITAYEWRANGVATGDTTATPPTLSSYVMQQITCAITHSGGTIETPAQKVHMTHADPMHSMMDDEVLALVPHEEATHIVRQSGNHSSASTWHGGAIPGDGANILVPDGLTYNYDLSGTSPRFRSIRLDGKMTSSDQTSEILVYDFIIGQDGELEIGQPGNRFAGDITFKFLDRDPRRNAAAATNNDLRRDPALRGRGMLCIGRADIWGRERSTHMPFKPVSSGATSIDIVDRFGFGLPAEFKGLRLNDTLVILGTNVSSVTTGPVGVQDEEVTVTDITPVSGGHRITFTPALTYDHKDYITDRGDHYPVALAKENGNITFTSESTDDKRKGHVMFMHGACEIDLWGGVDFVNLGRTNHADLAGKVDSNGDFRRVDLSEDVVTVTLADDSNIIGRYGGPHFHRCGYREDVTNKRRECHDVYVGEVSGHGIVHHDCHMNIIGYAVYRFFGSGIVAEQGSETGLWTFGLSASTTNDTALMTGNALNRSGSKKVMEEDTGRAGINGRFGFGQSLRSRGIINGFNYSVGCVTGIVGYHRANTNPDNLIAAPVDPSRVSLYAHYSGLGSQGLEDQQRIQFEDTVLRLDNIRIQSCLSGIEITKTTPNQNSQLSNIWDHIQMFGIRDKAADPEYVRLYLFVYGDFASGDGSQMGTNLFDSGFVYCQTATLNGDAHLDFRGQGDTVPGGASADNYDSTQPRWWVVGHIRLTSGDVHEGSMSGNSVTTDYTDILYENADVDHSLVDFSIAPTTTYPRQIGTWDGSTGGSGYTSTISNADGAGQSDGVFTNIEMFPRPSYSGGDSLVPSTSRRCNQIKNNLGFVKMAGTDNLFLPVIYGSLLTGRSEIYGHTITGTSADAYGGTSDGQYIGTLTVNATPLACDDIYITCAKDGSVTFDPTTGATGSSGNASITDLYGNISLIEPHYGTITTSGDSITYTVLPDFEGRDYMYVSLYDDGHWKTVKVYILVGSAGSTPTPVDGTHFNITGGSGQITIDFKGDGTLVKPATKPRKPETAFYSTDGGTTWAVLCINWAQMPHVITTESDGTTALTAGSYSVRVKYKTDYDETESAASVAQSITVT